MPYVNNYDREKEIVLMDKLAEQQVVITKRRRSLAMARSLLKRAQEDVSFTKREIFINRFGEAVLANRKENAKKAGLAHSKRAEERRALEKWGPAPQPPLASLQEAANELLIEACKAAAQSQPLSDPFATVTPAAPAPPKPEPVRSPEAIDSTGYNDGTDRRCQRCKNVITRRGLCTCPGVRHREFRILTKGPAMNIKHAPVPAYQMASKEGVD